MKKIMSMLILMIVVFSFCGCSTHVNVEEKVSKPNTEISKETEKFTIDYIQNIEQRYFKLSSKEIHKAIKEKIKNNNIKRVKMLKFNEEKMSKKKSSKKLTNRNDSKKINMYNFERNGIRTIKENKTLKQYLLNN